jgi:reactive intermediate/imine deaminase
MIEPKIEKINAPVAPTPLGPYSHAVAYGGLVFVSGMAARDPKTNKIPGLEMSGGVKTKYDIRAETRGTIENIRQALEAAGSSLAKVIEVNVYLLDMKDFGAYNEAYSEYFNESRPARTTVAVAGLPGDISIEMKVVAAR